MNLPTVQTETAFTLPALVDRAVQALAGARSAAEVLEARELASLAYDAAKRATFSTSLSSITLTAVAELIGETA